MTITNEEIKRKKKELEKIKKQLNTEFFGLSEIISKLVDSIQSWYILPDVLTRPVIVNLIGLTGVGKTQLVRSLVQKLNFNNKFVEVQMDGISNGSGYDKDSICSILESSSIEEGQPGILLLDEFQRFRTIDRDQSDVKLERFQDVWMLLSDGKFAANFSLYSKLEQEMAYNEYLEDIRKVDEANEEDEDDDEDDRAADEEEKLLRKIFDEPPLEKSRKPKKKKKNKIKLAYKYKIYPSQARDYKQLLKLTDSVEEIMTWPKEKLNNLCKQALAQRKSSQIDFSKLLIFVCGNLDEAFRVADSTEDCDTDADIYHKITKKVSVIQIKAALQTRFKPEQISRLGNNFIIYPSLNRDSYQKLIKFHCSRYIKEMETATKIKFSVDQSLYDEIYVNSVYPTQGTRPVFSSIHKILGGTLINVVLWCIENNILSTRIGIDSNKMAIYAVNSKGESKLFPVDLDIRKTKKDNSVDFNTLVAVHEAGHAIVYAKLFGFAPLEININIASFKGGYMMSDENTDNAKNILDKISVSMAGTVAEAVIFGEDYRSIGCESDIMKATNYAAKYIRRWGFGEISSVVLQDEENFYNENVKPTNEMVENIVKCRKDSAQVIIEDNESLLKDIVNKLMNDNTIKAEEFIEIAAKHGLKVKDKDKDVTHSYSNAWEMFANNVK